VDKRALGNSGLEVSALGFGCVDPSGGYGPPMDRADAIALIRSAADRGVTLFDSGSFASEELVGEAVKGIRHQLVVTATSRFGGDDVTSGSPRPAGRPERIRQACDASLKRLQTDYLDVFFSHRLDPEVPVEDVAGTVRELIAKGKVRYFGLPETSAETIRRAHAIQPVAAVRAGYSLWTRNQEHEMLPTCSELGIGFVARCPFGPGHHPGCADGGRTSGGGGLRAQAQPAAPATSAPPDPKPGRLNRIASRHNATSAQIGLVWLLAQQPWIVPVPGATSLAQLYQHLLSPTIRLSETELSELGAAPAEIKLHGPRPSPEQTDLADR
jgi:aryl-alcohol dehydrogenase-like predicted oxidoreductase